MLRLSQRIGVVAAVWIERESGLKGTTSPRRRCRCFRAREKIRIEVAFLTASWLLPQSLRGESGFFIVAAAYIMSGRTVSRVSFKSTAM